MSIKPWELMEKGGSWLGKAREYLQWHVRDGDRLTWGSNDPVNITVKQIEEMASEIAATVINAHQDKQLTALREENIRKDAQIREAISILESGTDYEKLHVTAILRNALENSDGRD